MYQSGGTIKDALDRIAGQEYVLPAIQREFVWKPEQICALFDSVMQGYPFGEFLFWRIAPENSGSYRCYGFARDYHQRDNPHCPDLGTLPDKPLIAVLDGQQRLTAFNIGLRGSMAIKLPRLWWSSPNAFPQRVLALDLLAETEERDEEGSRYKFDFVDEHGIGRHGSRLWFKVPDILNMKSGPDMLDWLLSEGLDPAEQGRAYRTLDRLHRVVHVEPTVAYYEERSQDIEHVLNIFIRRNSGGTVLAYSDLLLSIATSQWDNRDARKEVHQLVDELNRIGPGFGLSKDFVLKAGLMLTDVNVGFQVRNFTHANMATLEQNWDRVGAALTSTILLAASFGFDGSTIRASSALLPVAYYLYRTGTPDGFIARNEYADDRKAIRAWLIRSILKASGIWGSGLDTLLTALRDVLRDAGQEHFPAAEMSRVMAQRGKSLEFSREEIEDLADMGISDRRTFSLLTLLFPFVDVRSHHFHIDHVFPKSRFTESRLRNAGVSDDRIGEFIDCANRIANLQLLDGNINNEKRARLPSEWMQERFPDDVGRRHYRDQYLLGEVGRDIFGFMSFYSARRERMQQKIAELVNLA